MSEQAEGAAMNWFRQGVFAPVTEEITAFDLPVTGHLPHELNGRYLRNGPNFMRGIDDNKHHWFLGSGMVHGVRLRDGRAEWYRNRWVRAKAVAEALGERWREGPIHDHDFAANTHILAHAGRILATVEGGALPYEITDELNRSGLTISPAPCPPVSLRIPKPTCRRARFTRSGIRFVRIMSSTSSSIRRVESAA